MKTHRHVPKNFFESRGLHVQYMYIDLTEICRKLIQATTNVSMFKLNFLEEQKTEKFKIKLYKDCIFKLLSKWIVGSLWL